MRISEKTVELNFCKGLPQALGHDLFWFGLTQKQEAEAGFDACARFNSELLLFQIKASRNVLKSGARRFLAEHDQMQILRNQVKANRRVFYVLPIIGTTPELIHGLCFSHCSRYLDVSQLPLLIPPPLAKGKTTVRKSNCHYLDMADDFLTATIHSDPLTVKLVGVHELSIDSDSPPSEADGQKNEVHFSRQMHVSGSLDSFGEFWSELDSIDRSGLYGAFAV